MTVTMHSSYISENIGKELMELIPQLQFAKVFGHDTAKGYPKTVLENLKLYTQNGENRIQATYDMGTNITKAEINLLNHLPYYTSPRIRDISSERNLLIITFIPYN